jgi:hypothetical protein
MSRALPITGEYPADWPDIGDRVRAEAGHRCIRCGHPFRTGQHGKGQWTPCDENCTHLGPTRFLSEIGEGPTTVVTNLTAGECVQSGRRVEAEWRILTVHHLSGDKSDCHWSNLLALCQRCHLQVQCRVNPEVPYFLEHSDWFKPYAAAFYARKYLNQTLTREQVMERLEELLALERLA